MNARIALVLIAATAFAAAAAAAEVQVQLRPYVAVHAEKVYLGDVAYVRGTELAAVRRLVMLPLGAAPRTRSEARLSRETLIRWARSQLGGVAGQAHWTGADEVSIRSAARELHADRSFGAERGADREALPAVARGEWVTLLARSSGIELESRAEALQDAHIGQPVRVRSAGASGSVVARVVARGRVEMAP